MSQDRWSVNDYDDVEYNGAALSRWQKDGAWHIALPCPDPSEDGLATGGFMWTPECYRSKEDAMKAIDEAIK